VRRKRGKPEEPRILPGGYVTKEEEKGRQGKIRDGKVLERGKLCRHIHYRRGMERHMNAIMQKKWT